MRYNARALAITANFTQRIVYNALALLFFVFFIVIFTSVFSSSTAHAAQTIPYKINFQGRLTDATGNTKTDGLYNMKLRLYSAATGGSAIWTETRETTNRVQITNGLFSIQLGDVTALSPSIFTNYPLYLEIEFPTPVTANCTAAACGVYTEGAMTPRSPLGSSPYAFNADTVDGIDGSSLARNDANNTFSVGSVNTFSAKTQINDTLSIGNTTALGFNVTQSSGTLQLQNAASGGYLMNDATGLSIAAVAAGAAGSNVTSPPTLKLVANNLLVQAAVDGGVTYGDNLISNPGFEFGCAGWLACDASTTIAPASGASNYRFTQANTTTAYEILSRSIAMQAGDQLYVSAKVKTSAATTGEGGYYIRWMDASGNALAFSNGDWANPGTSYITRSGTYTAPPNTVYAAVSLSVRGTSATTAGTWDFDDIYAKQVNQTSPVLFQNSSNSVYAFSIQNAAGAPLLVADTSNFEVRIGDGDSNANDTPTLLVLDHKSNGGDPTGYNGAMYYNAAVKKFRCYEDSLWKDCVSTLLGLRSGYLYQTDLVSGTYPANGSAVDTTINSSVSSSGLIEPLGSVPGHPGIARFTVSTNTGYSGLTTSTNTTSAPVRFGTGAWSYLSNVRIPVLSDGTQNITFRSGFLNSATTGAEGGITNGCYLRYSYNVNNNKWQGVCRQAGTESVCDTDAIVSTTAGWDVLNVIVNDAGTTATFTVNDSSQCTISTNIPLSSSPVGFGFTLQKTLGGTARSVDVDYIDARGTFQR